MSEPRPQDLRRLEALEERLGRARAERSDLAAERRELRRTLAAAERRAKAAERAAGQLEERLAALVEENRGLAARLDELAGAVETVERGALEARKETDAAQKELAAARQAAERAEGKLAEAEAARDRAVERLGVVEEQLKAGGGEALLPAGEVAKLVDAFVGDLGGSLPGMVVRDGEIRLQVAFGKAGKASGFVVPTPESSAEVRQSLHELAVRFERGVELPDVEPG